MTSSRRADQGQGRITPETQHSDLLAIGTLCLSAHSATPWWACSALV